MNEPFRLDDGDFLTSRDHAGFLPAEEQNPGDTAAMALGFARRLAVRCPLAMVTPLRPELHRFFHWVIGISGR